MDSGYKYEQAGTPGLYYDDATGYISNQSLAKRYPGHVCERCSNPAAWESGAASGIAHYLCLRCVDDWRKCRKRFSDNRKWIREWEEAFTRFVKTRPTSTDKQEQERRRYHIATMEMYAIALTQLGGKHGC